MLNNQLICLGVCIAFLQGGCTHEGADVDIPVDNPAFQGGETANRRQYIEAFADKNDNGKFDGTDTKLYWYGSTLSSAHTIVLPKYKRVGILAYPDLTISSDKDIIIERSLLCGSKSAST